MINSGVERVLVIGGGIAGTTTAIALRRLGIEVELLERDEEWGSSGSGISLMAPALRVLSELDLFDRCLSDGYAITKLNVCDAAGETLDVVTLQQLLGPGSPGIVGILRTDLHRILSGAVTESGAAVRLGLTADAFEQTGDGVRVRFSDGTFAPYDLVVAADGWLSETRRMLLGDAAPEPQFLGQAVWRALVERPTEQTGSTFLYGSSHKAGMTPINDGQMYLFVVEPARDRFKPERARSPELMRELLAEFGGTAARVRETIQDPAQVDVRPLHKLIMPPPWNVGRVLLVGDAVHTTTPQMGMGGAIAMEDGIVLAELLGREQDLETALRAFASRRYERCRMTVENSAQLSEWEKDAAAHSVESARLMSESLKTFAQPI